MADPEADNDEFRNVEEDEETIRRIERMSYRNAALSQIDGCKAVIAGSVFLAIACTYAVKDGAQCKNTYTRNHLKVNVMFFKVLIELAFVHMFLNMIKLFSIPQNCFLRVILQIAYIAIRIAALGFSIKYIVMN